MSSANRPVSRPLSPHLQVYKMQMTSVLSISHRIAGVALSAGVVWLVVWICAAASRGGWYERVAAVNGSIIGKICLFGWTVCLFYHLFNGIRHLFWDAGHGFEIKDAERSGWLVLAATLVCSVGCWLIAGTMR